MPTLVLDNGANTIKAGFAGGNVHHIFNGMVRTRDRRLYIANEFEDCRDYTSLLFRRPVERGHLTSWELEKVIWDWIFDRKVVGNVEPSETTLIYTEMPYTLASLSVHTDQIVFEEYEFEAYRRCSAASLVPWNDLDLLFRDGRPYNPAEPADACLVVDSGFSATTAVPVVRGKTQYPAVRRLDIGGKLLTNYLKELVSFRYYNMMDETYIINSIKEQLCYVSADFGRDLRAWKADKHAFQKGYALPDSNDNNTGRVVATMAEVKALQSQGEAQVMLLGNERFTIPEALFEPINVGIDQAGVSETVAQAILASPPEAQALLWSNVVLTGGTANFENYGARLEAALRTLAPNDAEVRVRTPPNPTDYAWEGGSCLGQSPALPEWVVTRQEYLEVGESACLRKFGKNPGGQPKKITERLI